jgi:hypothetical protein
MACYLTFEGLRFMPTGLTFRNSAFCPQSVFACYVLISEEPAIISLNNVSWLAFGIGTEYINWVVWNEPFTMN